MNALSGKPHLLKQANLSCIRKAIKTMYTATRAEIVNETKISSTTVRFLLSEMMQNGEIESIGYDESSGGRKAERYRLKPDRYYGAAFCITANEIYGLLINICGEIIETTKLDATADNCEGSIFSFLDDLLQRREIKSIGVGVPGIVEGGAYWRKDKKGNKKYKIYIGDALAKRYHIPILLENDLNAAAIGFGHRHIEDFSCDNPKNMDIAYLNFEKDCVSAGFLSDGRLIRGCNNFAGELGLVPLCIGQLLDAYMSQVMNDIQYIKIIIQIISWICGILNPQYIILGGASFRKECLDAIRNELSTMLPAYLFAKILYSPDIWHDYFCGMAHLTANKMFDEVKLVMQ